MPKFQSLINNTLKEILRAHELPTTGNKAELIQRLINALGTDEIHPAELNSILPQSAAADDTQQKVAEMQRKLDQMMAVLEAQQNNENASQRRLDEMMQAMNNLMANQQAEQREPPSAAQNAVVPELNEQSIVRDAVNVPTAPSPLVTNASEMVENASIRTSMRDVIAVLPEFDPNHGHVTSRKFVDKVESLMATYSWPENVVLYAVQSKLKGYAKTWVDSQDVFNTWQDFVNMFLNDFPIVEDAADVHIELIRRRQRKEETNVDYYYRVLALGRQGKLDERSIIKHCINGLADENAQRTLSAMQFETCASFLKALTGIVSTSKPYRPTNDYSLTSREKTNRPQNTGYKPPICYNCNEPGHISVDCTKPQRKQRCTKCNRVHARGTPCTTNTHVNATENHSTSEKAAKDSMFEVPVKIEDRTLVALVDTGSQSSLIKKSLGELLTAKKENCRFKIVGVCGGSQTATQQCHVDIDVNGTKITTNLLLLDDECLSNDILLGQDIFGDGKVRLMFENGVTKIIRKIDTTLHKLDETNLNCETADEKVKTDLLNLLNDFPNVFSTGLHDMGETNLVTMKIEIKPNTVVCQKPYRVPAPKREVVDKMIKEMLENDIITPSESVFASPIILTKKKDGGDRFCVDYRRLNSLTQKEHFPLSNIEECLHDAARFKYYTTLDLNNGYYQVLLDPESRKYTAFITEEGQYEFKRMPFGLMNAPVVFLRLMAKIQERVGKHTMMHYMDDILIGANTVEEMLAKIKRVLEVLEEANVTLNLGKCEFLKTSVKFLGHELVPDGIKPGHVKTEAIANFKAPENVTEVRRFLGLSGYFRRFVPYYAIIAEPLRRLLRKDEAFEWGEEQQIAFESLKNKLTTEPVMAAYDVEGEHEIHTDASKHGLAGVLLQKVAGELKPVAYYSRSTTPTERNYHSYELETLAVVETLERLRYYVYGKTITLVTDCSAVEAAMTKRELIPRIARWWLKVQDFDLILVHRQGSRMEHVDALSRMPLAETNEPEVATLRINKTAIDEQDWLASMQLQDVEIQELAKKLATKDKTAMADYVLRDGRVFKKANGKELWVAPKSIRWQLLFDNHNKVGHLGVDKTLERLRTYVWFARMRNFCKSYCNACVQCAYNKHKGGRMEGEYHFTDPEPVPWHTVHIDHLGPFPKTARRNEHLLVLVDSFTKYTILKSVKSTATKWVIAALDEAFACFGVPSRIVTDRGTAFSSNQFKSYCNDNDIHHILNAVRTPRANGHAERANRTILSMMTTLTENDKQWDRHISEIQWSLNTMVNATTKKTPHELLFAYTPRDFLHNKILLTLNKNQHNNANEMTQLRQAAVENISREKNMAKIRFDQKRSPPTKYAEGELVLVENEPAATGTSRKLEPRYKGPFIIKRVLDNDRYVLEDLPKTKRTQRHYSSVYASDRMKRYCQPPVDCDESEDESGSEDAWN